MRGGVEAEWEVEVLEVQSWEAESPAQHSATSYRSAPIRGSLKLGLPVSTCPA